MNLDNKINHLVGHPLAKLFSPYLSGTSKPYWAVTGPISCSPGCLCFCMSSSASYWSFTHISHSPINGGHQLMEATLMGPKHCPPFLVCEFHIFIALPSSLGHRIMLPLFDSIKHAFLCPSMNSQNSYQSITLRSSRRLTCCSFMYFFTRAWSG